MVYCWTTTYADRAYEHFSFATKVGGQLTQNDIILYRNEVLETLVKVAEVTEELESSRKRDEVSTGRNQAFRDLLIEVFVGLVCRQTSRNNIKARSLALQQ